MNTLFGQHVFRGQKAKSNVLTSAFFTSENPAEDITPEEVESIIETIVVADETGVKVDQTITNAEDPGVAAMRALMSGIPATPADPVPAAITDTGASFLPAENGDTPQDDSTIDAAGEDAKPTEVDQQLRILTAGLAAVKAHGYTDALNTMLNKDGSLAVAMGYTKDAKMTAVMFKQGYNNIFLGLRKHYLRRVSK